MAIASYKRRSLWQTKFHGRNCRHQPFYPINLKKGATRGLEWMQIAQVGAINLKRFSLAVWLSAVRHLFVLTILSPANCKLQTRPPLPPEFPNIHCHIHIYFFKNDCVLTCFVPKLNMINLKKSGYISFKSTDSTHTYKMCGKTFIPLDLFYSTSRIDSKFVRWSNTKLRSQWRLLAIKGDAYGKPSSMAETAATNRFPP